MLQLFKNSGVLLLVILSFFVTHTKREIESNRLAQVEILPQISAQTGEIVYVATTQDPQPYGIFTSEIEEILSVTPTDSEIYIEEREGGKWYLKIEKLFSSETSGVEEVMPIAPQELAPPATSIDEPKFVSPQNYAEGSLLV